MREKRLTESYVDEVIARALEEDLGHGDITTDTLIPDALIGRAILLAKGEGVLAGLEVAGRVFRKVESTLEFKVIIPDGSRIKRGDVLATVAGRIAGILKGERTALNFVQRLSGIATQTARYVRKLKGTRVYIADTRKTTPGLRMLEKYAVRMGGGTNHRLHLGDGVLIKDNHLAALRFMGMSLKDIVRKARENTPRDLEVEVEVTSVTEALEAAAAGADIVMLDNMKPEDMRQVMSTLSGKVRVEASGGINLDTVRTVAETGVTFISAGALTHSAKALDISLELETDSFRIK
jgi:nicotinate-nucleotide pyrophosphorylase (carboxylating)